MIQKDGCLIVYASVHHGNTRVVAETMARAIGSEAMEVGARAREAVKGASLVGLGTGVYFGSPHKSLLAFVEQLPSGERPKASFIFSTSGSGRRLARLAGRDYHGKLRGILRDMDMPVLGEFDCKGYDTYGIWGRLGGIAKGHPDSKDLADAAVFVREMLEKMPARNP